ncbi:MAG TPA: potassium channel family protein [Acidimicrobiales bacterium]|nr:potassium channel family protein [Acidimicrobiales bacterium]
MDALWVVLGAALVVWILVDSFETLLATNLRSGRWSFTRGYYDLLWPLYRRLALRLRDEARRERWLARFGPASFLGLLVAWTTLEIFGWGLIWWGLRNGFHGAIDSPGDAWYFSGVVYFSIGFGDILPSSGLLRALTIVEGLSGLGTLGLVIGYLPSLNAAYSAREKQLLLLDDLTDERVTPVTLVRAYLDDDGDTARLDAVFDEWAAWCAEIYDSHTSFPVLVWFRSKHRGHSWITGLGVVTDAAIAFAAAVPGADRGSAIRLQRQAVRLVNGLGERVGLPPDATLSPLRPELWRVGYDTLAATGVEVRSFEESYETLIALRADFHPMMEAFIDELLAPRGFWGVTAADHLAASSIDVLFDVPPGEPGPPG